MVNEFSVIPWMPWLVGTRADAGQRSCSMISGPLVHVCADVSVKASILASLGIPDFPGNGLPKDR